MTQSYAGGRFCVTVDGQTGGFIKSVSGGNIKGEVGINNLGATNLQTKQLTTVTHEAFTIECGMGMSAYFYEWIQASFARNHQSRSGEVIAADAGGRGRSAREFVNAHITEVTIPALDGSSKEPAYMTLKFEPAQIRYNKRNGEDLTSKIGNAQKKWLCSGFRFELGGLPCNRVTKIDSFTWKQSVAKEQVGAFREYTLCPGKVEVPNLKVTMTMADVERWQDWHKSFVIDGKCSQGHELNGSITFLAPDASEELGVIELLHVGIISLNTAKLEANKENIACFEVELYVEEMKFRYIVNDGFKTTVA